MMPAGNLARMVFANTVRSPRHFILSVFGIVIGIASFVFFLALSTGVSNVLLGKIFPIEQVEVRAPHASLLGKDISKKLDDSVVATIKERSEVADALPRMNLVFPALGYGTFEGEELKFEVGGFADGINESFVADDPKLAEQFKDWDTLEPHRPTCTPPPRFDEDDSVPAGSGSGSASGSGSGAPAAGSGSGSAAPAAGSGSGSAAPAAAAGSGSGTGSGSGNGTGSGSGSGTGSGNGTGSGSGSATKAHKLKPHSLTHNECAHPELYYCDEHDHTCHHRVPVIVSPTLIEIYNGQFATAHNLPEIGELEQFIAKRGGFGSMSFEIGLGDTMVAGSNTPIEPGKMRHVQAVVIGISAKAVPIGMTMPLAYIRRWNKEYMGEDAAKQYSKIVVTLRDKDRLTIFNQWVMDNGLRLEDSLGERFATAIFVVTLLFFLISFVIVSISAINIAHNFFMQVSERRREIGVLRAVGATRLDVRLIILGEAAVIGIVGGVLGIAVAWLSATGVNYASAHYLPRFPFKPDSYFDFKSWILGGGLGFSTVFCVLGGFLPARRASLLEPAQALAAQ